MQKSGKTIIALIGYICSIFMLIHGFISNARLYDTLQFCSPEPMSGDIAERALKGLPNRLIQKAGITNRRAEISVNLGSERAATVWYQGSEDAPASGGMRLISGYFPRESQMRAAAIHAELAREMRRNPDTLIGEEIWIDEGRYTIVGVYQTPGFFAALERHSVYTAYDAATAEGDTTLELSLQKGKASLYGERIAAALSEYAPDVRIQNIDMQARLNGSLLAIGTLIGILPPIRFLRRAFCAAQGSLKDDMRRLSRSAYLWENLRGHKKQIGTLCVLLCGWGAMCAVGVSVLMRYLYIPPEWLPETLIDISALIENLQNHILNANSTCQIPSHVAALVKWNRAYALIAVFLNAGCAGASWRE